MQQPEAAVGQTALRGKPASQMTSRNQKFETLGEAVMDALKDGTAADGLIKTDLVLRLRRRYFPSADIITGTYIWGKRR